MDRLFFDWDKRKNEINQEKHKVSFEEASTVFYDPNALLRNDPDHSMDEERFVLLGMSYNARLLVVVHCFRESETLIRIISARKATKTEMEQYAKGGAGYER